MSIDRRDLKFVEPYKGFEILKSYGVPFSFFALNPSGKLVQMYNQDTSLEDIKIDLDKNRAEYMPRNGMVDIGHYGNLALMTDLKIVYAVRGGKTFQAFDKTASLEEIKRVLDQLPDANSNKTDAR